MSRKKILNFIYSRKLCENITTRFPWGWKSKDIIDKEKGILTETNEPFYHNYHSFESNDFLKYSKDAYNIIYKNYLDKVDFLDYKYTNPSLSIALNKLRNKIKNEDLNSCPRDINTIDNYILSNRIVYNVTTCNFKILGFTTKNEIKHNIFMGLASPDVNDLKSQYPTKQIINVLYLSEDFYDILEWERDLLELNPEWQVSNINNILPHNI